MRDENAEVGAQGFYQAVAQLLGCQNHSYRKPVRKRTRWNNRSPGNGRFEGHGIVRYFGPSNILVRFTNPFLNGLFTSPEDALEAIENACKEKFLT